MSNKILLKTFILGLILEILSFPVFLFLMYDADSSIGLKIIASMLVPLSLIIPICCVFFLILYSKLDNEQEEIL